MLSPASSKAVLAEAKLAYTIRPPTDDNFLNNFKTMRAETGAGGRRTARSEATSGSGATITQLRVTFVVDKTSLYDPLPDIPQYIHIPVGFKNAGQDSNTRLPSLLISCLPVNVTYINLPKGYDHTYATTDDTSTQTCPDLTPQPPCDHPQVWPVRGGSPQDPDRKEPLSWGAHGAPAHGLSLIHI